MPMMWMEPRCSLMTKLSGSVYRLKGECHETGPGMFARRVSEASWNAKYDGWIVRCDDWICPACAGKEAP
jgi:hypothetical protein